MLIGLRLLQQHSFPFKELLLKYNIYFELSDEIEKIKRLDSILL